MLLRANLQTVLKKQPRRIRRSQQRNRTPPLAGDPTPKLAIKPGKAFAEGMIKRYKDYRANDGACQGISAK